MVLKKQLTAQQIAELLCRKSLNPLFPFFEGLGKKTQIRLKDLSDAQTL